MPKIKVTHYAINGVSKEDIFDGADYSIKDGWVNIIDDSWKTIASIRESDVLRIDKTVG